MSYPINTLLKTFNFVASTLEQIKTENNKEPINTLNNFYTTNKETFLKFGLIQPPFSNADLNVKEKTTYGLLNPFLKQGETENSNEVLEKLKTRSVDGYEHGAFCESIDQVCQILKTYADDKQNRKVYQKTNYENGFINYIVTALKVVATRLKGDEKAEVEFLEKILQYIKQFASLGHSRKKLLHPAVVILGTSKSMLQNMIENKRYKINFNILSSKMFYECKETVTILQKMLFPKVERYGLFVDYNKLTSLKSTPQFERLRALTDMVRNRDRNDSSIFEIRDYKDKNEATNYAAFKNKNEYQKHWNEEDYEIIDKLFNKVEFLHDASFIFNQLNLFISYQAVNRDVFNKKNLLAIRQFVNDVMNKLSNMSDVIPKLEKLLEQYESKEKFVFTSNIHNNIISLKILSNERIEALNKCYKNLSQERRENALKQAIKHADKLNILANSFKKKYNISFVFEMVTKSPRLEEKLSNKESISKDNGYISSLFELLTNTLNAIPNTFKHTNNKIVPKMQNSIELIKQRLIAFSNDNSVNIIELEQINIDFRLIHKNYQKLAQQEYEAISKPNRVTIDLMKSVQEENDYHVLTPYIASNFACIQSYLDIKIKMFKENFPIEGNLHMENDKMKEEIKKVELKLKDMLKSFETHPEQTSESSGEQAHKSDNSLENIADRLNLEIKEERKIHSVEIKKITVKLDEHVKHAQSLTEDIERLKNINKIESENFKKIKDQLNKLQTDLANDSEWRLKQFAGLKSKLNSQIKDLTSIQYGVGKFLKVDVDPIVSKLSINVTIEEVEKEIGRLDALKVEQNKLLEKSEKLISESKVMLSMVSQLISNEENNTSSDMNKLIEDVNNKISDFNKTNKESTLILDNSSKKLKELLTLATKKQSTNRDRNFKILKDFLIEMSKEVRFNGGVNVQGVVQSDDKMFIERVPYKIKVPFHVSEIFDEKNINTLNKNLSKNECDFKTELGRLKANVAVKANKKLFNLSRKSSMQHNYNTWMLFNSGSDQQVDVTVDHAAKIA